MLCIAPLSFCNTDLSPALHIQHTLRYTYTHHGAVAQSGERLLCTEEVRGSTPLSSTNTSPSSAFSTVLYLSLDA